MSFKYYMTVAEVVCGLLFSSAGCVGFGLEFRNKCTTGLIFWLPGMIVLTLIRETMLVYDRGDGRRSDKFRELLIGWAFVGNIVIASSYQCAKITTPIMYYSSLICILLIDLLLTLYTFTVCGDTCCPRTMFILKRRFHVVNEADGEAPLPQFMSDRGTGIVEMTTSRSVFWKAWLESYDCDEHIYSSGLFVGKTRTLSEDISSGRAQTEINNVTVDISGVNVACAANDVEAPVDNSAPSDVTTSTPSPENFILDPPLVVDTEQTVITPPSLGITRSITPPPGYRSVPLDSDYHDDGLTCAICLLLLEEAPVSEIAAEAAADATTERDVECGLPTTTKIESVVVRYPCHGSHYFHAPCLHHWLQSVSARLVGGGGASGLPNYQKITCPICREAPFRVGVHPASTSSAPWPVPVRHTYHVQPSPPASPAVIRAADTIIQLI